MIQPIFKINNIIKYFLLLLCISFTNLPLVAQNNYIITHEDSLALENVMVEKYHVADSTDYKDTTGGALPKGSVTYRIFIDMKPGYTLQMVYGDKNHPLTLETSTTFYNDRICTAETGFNIDIKKIQFGSVAFDSWITMGAAAHGYTGVPLSEDNTESFSFLESKPAFKKKDGITKAVLPDLKTFNLDLSFFNNDSNATKFSTDNGGWAALRGVKGPTFENRVIIAQLTTTGTLSFKINVQLGTPTGGYIKFVYGNPISSEIKNDQLKYN
jgi:hypothetical protein